MPTKQAIKDFHGIRNLVVYGGLLVLILIGVLSAVIFIDRHNESNRRQRENDSKVDARIESCHLYNKDQTKNREHDHDQIVKIVELRAGQEGVKELLASQFIKEYDLFTASDFPYRQCSTDCVNAIYDSAIPDCSAASNEDGNP